MKERKSFPGRGLRHPFKHHVLTTVFSAVLLLLFIFSGEFLWPLFSASPSINQRPDYSQIIPAYEQFVVSQMARDRVPGLSVAFQHEDFFWARGFGSADLENDVPALAESSYRLASITKTITALAILLLYEEGRIDLEAEVQKYVPYFPRKPWPITIRQLLGHLGGISHYRNYELEGHIREPKTTREALAIFQDFGLVAEPGTRYNYSTYGYNLLGAVVEEVSGIPYGEFIRRQIFEPLGMTNSRLDSASELIPNRVCGYRLVDGELRPSEFIDTSSRFAGGGVRSTVVDLVRYGYGLIVEGRLLRPETRRMMLTSMIQRNGFYTNYGLGWVVDPWNGHVHVNHGGSQQETRTHLAVFPEERLVIAVACNLEGTNLTPYVRKLAELIFTEKLDRPVYTTSVDSAIIWKACELTFNYGLSQYVWNKGPLSPSPSDLKESFDIFNRSLNPKNLLKSRSSGRKLVLTGIHPAGRQVLTKIGSFMASALMANGSRPLEFYRKEGPLAFFRDYIRLSESQAKGKSLPRFQREWQQLIELWARDWPKTFTPEWTEATFPETTNWAELTRRLRKAFSGAVIYPDLSAAFINASQAALNRQKNDQAIEIIHLGLEVYPLSPALKGALGVSLIWKGDVAGSRQAFQQAFSLDPYHPAISPDRLITLGSQLLRARKIKEALALGQIALELYPREARLHYEYGRLNLQAGNKERAILALETALSLDPNLEEARLALEGLKKK